MARTQHSKGRLTYRDQIVAMLTRDPKTTRDELRRITGAPRIVIDKVRRDMVAAGIVKRGPSYG